MDTERVLDLLRSQPGYAGQIAHIHHRGNTEACYGVPYRSLAQPTCRVLQSRGIQQLYTHQAEAIDAFNAGHNVVIATSTASGKSLCYWLPMLELLARNPEHTTLLLFPTKALCHDQYLACKAMLTAAGYADHNSAVGIIDGDTPGAKRRVLLEKCRILFTNPDMLHASLLPNHGSWADFLARLRLMIIDELHTYNGLFGSNCAHLFARCWRIFKHYGAVPQVIACSATLANPQELAEKLIGKPFILVDNDGSPQGDRTYVLWNPPVTHPSGRRTRRSANVEAHELMSLLVSEGVRTITFSKAKMTAEMICRYVNERLADIAPHMVRRVMAYRGGYLPSERRLIERQLFNGELMGISSTRALELGIDVGDLDACIIVGYPGNTAAFWQQAGRVGRRAKSALVIMVALDTPINQYIVEHPKYLFAKPVEPAIIEPRNPFISVGQLRCAARELPLSPDELGEASPHHQAILDVLEEKQMLLQRNNTYYHVAQDTPHHEVSLRGCSDATVVVQDIHSGKALGHLEKYDAGLLVHPGAVYMHQGETYLGVKLDLSQGLALVEKRPVDYYTQPFGGTGLHHVDRILAMKPLGEGMAYYGEVTTRFNMIGYERIPFYQLDAVSVSQERFNGEYIQTMSVFMKPADAIIQETYGAGLDAVSGLKGIVYATHMVMPLHIMCDTYDFWHALGCVNAPGSTMFIYEHHPFGLGFTRKAFEVLPAILDNVRQLIKQCDCTDGCPCCVGSPLRRDMVRNAERGEGSIPSKKTALFILERWLGETHATDACKPPKETEVEDENRLADELRRHLEHRSEKGSLHQVLPWSRLAEASEDTGGNKYAMDNADQSGSDLDSLHRKLRQRLLDGTLTDGYHQRN